jgi:hypothetical protein
LPDEVAELLDRSEERLEAAKHLVEGGHFPDSVSRAYYAMFFAARALLLAKGIEVRTHRGLVAGVYEHYVRPGLLGKDVAALLPAAMAARHEADYGFPDRASREEAIATIVDARRFLDSARKLMETR